MRRGEKLWPECVDLLLESGEGSVVGEDEVAGGGLFGVGNLRGEAAAGFDG